MGPKGALGSPLSGTAVITPVAVQVADLRAAGAYIPAGVGPDPVAGDFWDVIPSGPSVSLIVGDVSGHGADAMERMQCLRAAARAVVAVSPSPGRVLERLDGILQALGPEDLATLWCGLYEPATGVLRYSSAGHPPPAIRAPDGRTRQLALSDAPPLGTGFVTAVREHEATLAPGSVLVAYSDGLIERQGAHFDDQLALLAAVIEAACTARESCAPEAVVAGVLQALVPEPDAARDDVCVLVVRRAP